MGIGGNRILSPTCRVLAFAGRGRCHQVDGPHLHAAGREAAVGGRPQARRTLGLGPAHAEPDLLVMPYVRREAVESSRIEGTQANLSDLFLGEVSETPKDLPPDVLEVRNYVEAIRGDRQAERGGAAEALAPEPAQPAPGGYDRRADGPGLRRPFRAEQPVTSHASRGWSSSRRNRGWITASGRLSSSASARTPGRRPATPGAARACWLCTVAGNRRRCPGGAFGSS
jgi:hypothetical protein